MTLKSIRITLFVLLIPVFCAAQNAKIIVPAYAFPYDNANPGIHQVGPVWSSLIEAAKTYGNRLVVIANPYNGPGSGQGWEKQKYTEAINKVRQAGGTVLGYVHVCYGLTATTPICQGRTVGDIKSDLNKWKQWYNVDGFFLDEAPSSATHLSMIQDLDNYIVNTLGYGNGRILVNNFGTMPAGTYLNQAGWVSIIMENTAAAFDANVNSLPASGNANNAVLIHTLTSGSWQSRKNALNARQMGYYYITTDGSDWNPWDSLPSFFTQLF
ncbi:MAG: spherulation-specific family 4 protein [Bacteroidota bacterium]